MLIDQKITAVEAQLKLLEGGMSNLEGDLWGKRHNGKSVGFIDRLSGLEKRTNRLTLVMLLICNAYAFTHPQDVLVTFKLLGML